MMSFQVIKRESIKEIILMVMRLKAERKKRRRRNECFMIWKIFLTTIIMDTELINYYVRGPETLTEMADTYILVHGNRSSAVYWDQVVENLH